MYFTYDTSINFYNSYIYKIIGMFAWFHMSGHISMYYFKLMIYING